jgi:hypothetical protein
VMVATAYGKVKDPAPFLQFFLSIGVTFILGASATAVMNSWKVSSEATTQDLTEVKTDTEIETKNENITQRIERPKSYDDGTID